MPPDPFWYEVGMLASIFGSAVVIVGLVFSLKKRFPDAPLWRSKKE